MQLFKIPGLMSVSIITLVMIRSMAVAVFAVTRVGLLMVDIIPNET